MPPVTTPASTSARSGRQPVRRPPNASADPAPKAPRPAPRRRRKTTKQKVVLGILGVVALVLTAVIGVAVWGIVQFNRIDRVNVKLAAAGAGQPQNFLVVGSDTRDLTRSGPEDPGIFGADAPGGKRADTIVIARVDPTKATIEILSIPRDLWVRKPGTNQNERINSSYNDGPQQVIDTIHENLGIDINHYVEVDFSGFRGLVDAVDGVPMYFDRPVYDRNTGLNIKKKGCRTLTGTEALQFARSRHLVYSTGTRWETDPTGDLGRITRQQVFLRHALAKTTGLGLTDLNTVRKLIGVAVDSVRIDDTLSRDDMMDLAKKFSNFDAKQLVTHRLPATADTTDGGADILRLDSANAQGVIDIFTGRKPSSAASATTQAASAEAAPASVTVDVLNGTTITGLAKKMSERVAAGGFTVGTVATGPHAGATVIRYGAGAKAGATLLASKIAPAVQIVEDASVAPGGVQLIVVDDSLKIDKAPTTTAPTNAGTTAGGAGAVATGGQTQVGMVIGDPPPGVKCG